MKYSDGIVDDQQIVTELLNKSKLHYCIGSMSSSLPNTEENRQEVMNELIDAKYVPFLGNCQYGDEIMVLIKKLIFKDVINYNRIRLHLRVRLPYVESRQPHLTIDSDSDEKILNVMKVFKDNDVENRLILDLLNAE